jgi:hypothetical protein
MPNYQELTAPCGLDCFNCPLYEGIITDETRQMMAKRWNVQPEQVGCKGCRAEQGCQMHFQEGCATLDCVQAKGVSFCFECDEFPCSKLQPAVDGAAIYPHNTKVFHLCRMKAIGVERWAQEEALTIRSKYYKGKFVVGTGPVLE